MFVPDCAGVILVHAWLMILLFGFLYPSSAILAVSSRIWENLDPDHKLHASLGKMGAISFVFGIGAAAVSGNVSRLFRSSHSSMGTVIIILTFAQTKIGFFLSVESLWKGLADFLVRLKLKVQMKIALGSRRIRKIKEALNGTQVIPQIMRSSSKEALNGTQMTSTMPSESMSSESSADPASPNSDAVQTNGPSPVSSRSCQRRPSLQVIEQTFEMKKKDRMLHWFSTMQKVRKAHKYVGTAILLVTPYCIMDGWIIAYRDDWIPGEIPWYAAHDVKTWLFWYVPSLVLVFLLLSRKAIVRQRRKREEQRVRPKHAGSMLLDDEAEKLKKKEEEDALMGGDSWKKLPTMSLEDFQELADEGHMVCTWYDEMLIVDVSSWIKFHPGGRATIQRVIGKDISQPMKQTKSGHIHSNRARGIARSFAIARLSCATVQSAYSSRQGSPRQSFSQGPVCISGGQSPMTPMTPKTPCTPRTLSDPAVIGSNAMTDGVAWYNQNVLPEILHPHPTPPMKLRRQLSNVPRPASFSFDTLGVVTESPWENIGCRAESVSLPPPSPISSFHQVDRMSDPPTPLVVADGCVLPTEFEAVERPPWGPANGHRPQPLHPGKMVSTSPFSFLMGESRDNGVRLSIGSKESNSLDHRRPSVGSSGGKNRLATISSFETDSGGRLSFGSSGGKPNSDGSQGRLSFDSTEGKPILEGLNGLLPKGNPTFEEYAVDAEGFKSPGGSNVQVVIGRPSFDSEDGRKVTVVQETTQGPAAKKLSCGSLPFTHSDFSRASSKETYHTTLS